MKKSCCSKKIMKQAVGIALTIGGGILVTRFILNKINQDKEIYSVTVNFDEDEN